MKHLVWPLFISFLLFSSLACANKATADSKVTPPSKSQFGLAFKFETNNSGRDPSKWFFSQLSVLASCFVPSGSDPLVLELGGEVEMRASSQKVIWKTAYVKPLHQSFEACWSQAMTNSVQKAAPHVYKGTLRLESFWWQAGSPLPEGSIYWISLESYPQSSK